MEVACVYDMAFEDAQKLLKQMAEKGLVYEKEVGNGVFYSFGKQYHDSTYFVKMYQNGKKWDIILTYTPKWAIVVHDDQRYEIQSRKTV